MDADCGAEGTPDGPDITGLLCAWRHGDGAAHERLLRVIYPRLRQIAGQQLNRNGSTTLSATDVVHEGYLLLLKQRDTDFANRAHFFAIAAHVMRRLLVDHWRERQAQKRGGDMQRVTLSSADELASVSRSPVDVLELDRVLQRLEGIDPRAGKLVELRFFAGMSIEESAQALDLSIATAKRDWQFARAWLQDQLTASS